ncbi:hypothetical protein IMX26_15600 [Clostridium sp. 'deep sea']|uniref:hypothetical protein n=1 Tax=Clostridium sp. 'deep sea' TaxID=2779445 RepID=UPI0018967FD7|nr:hypothetical protein [Clostridium sp. 'deep sea']QOR34866.1 hypothetical protein IMX26_15600 [Clostridium sp. 'deep sea']
MGLKNIKTDNSKLTDLKSSYITLWHNTSCDFPDFNYKINYFNKLLNEREIEKCSKKLAKKIKIIPQCQSEKDLLSANIFTLIEKLESKIIGKNKSLIRFFSGKGYANITEQFIAEVKKFDSNMHFYDIFQAIRNVWIMNSIQLLFNIDVKMTDSIFSYSMLYPYSDNYLDDVNITSLEKKEFNNRFKAWLYDDKIQPKSQLEECIYKLVQRIKKEFPSHKYPQVSQSLIAIHAAQEKSMFQQAVNTPSENEILNISFEKGGTSVMADGYLVKGNLSVAEQEFLFSYGLLLQLIDDLQDVKEDLASDNLTIFSHRVTKGNLNEITNKLLRYIEVVFSQAKIIYTSETLKLKEIIQYSCKMMIIEAISKNKELYTKTYLKKIEQYSHVRLPYYQKLQRKLRVQYTEKELNNIFTAFSQQCS